MRCSDCRQSLDAYIDGQLSVDRAAEIRDHIERCADCSREHGVLSSVSKSVKANLMHLTTPPELRERIRAAVARDAAPSTGPGAVPRRFDRWPALAAAGLVIAIASSATTFALVRSRDHSGSVAEQVVASHIRSLMPGHLTDVASTNLHNVKPWFAGRIALSPAVPNLDSLGFPLSGGRLDYVDGRPVAAVVYLRRQHVINVYSWPENGGDLSPRRSADTHGYHLVWWRRNGVESWAISDVDPQDLDRFVASFR